MKSRRIGPFSVAEIGLGCMNLSHAYGVPPSAEAAERLLLEALDRGVTLFDTAALYGFGANEQLVGRVLKPHRSKIVLSSKGGMAGVTGDDGVTRRVIDGRPATLRRNCEDSLRRLGTEVIDLYYLHRVDLKNGVPIEDSVGALSRLVEEGKVRAIGLSEASAATLRRGHAVHPIAALQNEYSLWTRNAELGTLDACRELGIAFVAFSPLARAYLTGTLRDVTKLDAKDIRRQMPRFAPDAYAQNLRLLDRMTELAQEAGCTPARLALAWLLQRGEHVIPIPGTTNTTHLAENLGAAGVSLPGDLVQRLEDCINDRTVTGTRYTAATQAEIDTEQFPS